MATSGSTSFTMTVDELVDEAHSECGGQPILGNEAKTARRKLNLILLNWSNDNIFLWKNVYTTISCSVGQLTYTMDADTVDVQAAVFTRASTDTALDRMSFVEYLEIPKKTQAGRPSRFFIDRQRVTPVLYLWPIPDTSGDKVILSRQERIEDVLSAGEEIDVPARFLPALTLALAGAVCAKRKGASHVDTLRLEEKAAAAYALAVGNDRERAEFHVRPYVRRI